MKSNRILQIVLLALVVVFVAVGGFLYAADSREKKQHDVLNDAISKNQATLKSNLAQKTAKEKEAADLESQLAAAKALLVKADFRTSAQSIEYDRILFSIADGAKLQVNSLNATPSLDFKEKDTTYQLTTFTVTLEGLTPEAIFTATSDSTAYISATVTKILDFVNKVTTSADFDTAVIQSVNINAPKPMTDKDIKGLIEKINGMVEEEITDAIDALTEEIQTDNEGTLTQEEIDALIETETAKLVQKTLTEKNTDEVKALLEQVALDKPSAVITIKIWTYKGA
jgi:hypothetical protein